MNHRERYLETLLFGRPDRVPFCPGEPRESTLAAWRQQGLAEGADWRMVLLDTLRIDRQAMALRQSLGVDFRMIPQFEEKVLARGNGHLIVQDWKGNVCEISDCYDVTYLREPKDFVTRRWLRCPVENRDDWERMRERYDGNSAGRLPEGLEQHCRRPGSGDSVVTVSAAGPFWQMREWCGFEGLCMLMVEQPELVAEMAAFWTEFVSGVLDRVLRTVVPDAVEISEDMAYKCKAMISPVMTREFCKPSWDRWSGQLRAAGCPLMDMDSDGYIGELIPIWVESGINVCDPIEVAAGNDINEFRRRFGTTMAYRGGVDKRAMARGGRELRDEMKRLEPVVEDGGYIPSCDHGVPADVAWPDFVEYCRILARMTGW